MKTGILTARHRHGGQWHEAGAELTLDDDDAALLIAEGKFSPNAEGAARVEDGATAQPVPPIPQIPAQPKRKVGLTSED